MRNRPRSVGRALLATRVAAVAAVAPLLSRLRLQRLERVLEPHRTGTVADARRVDEVARTVDWVLGSVPLVQRHCLTRGITMYYFLRREGADVQLTFGMGDAGKGLAGHCWLVHNGEPYLEPKDPRPLFKEMYTIPRGAAAEPRA